MIIIRDSFYLQYRNVHEKQIQELNVTRKNKIENLVVVYDSGL